MKAIERKNEKENRRNLRERKGEVERGDWNRDGKRQVGKSESEKEKEKEEWTREREREKEKWASEKERETKIK